MTSDVPTLSFLIKAATVAVNGKAVVESKLPAKKSGSIDQASGVAVLLEVEEDMVQKLYHLGPAFLEEYSIRVHMMNVKTNEISTLKVKNVKGIPSVEKAVNQRVADVQKQFETYRDIVKKSNCLARYLPCRMPFF